MGLSGRNPDFSAGGIFDEDAVRLAEVQPEKE
jgi:hypothetical protein